MSNEFIPGDTPFAPLTPREAYSPDYWRDRAQRLRMKALLAPCNDAQELQRAATDFERLAERAAAVLAAEAV